MLASGVTDSGLATAVSSAGGLPTQSPEQIFEQVFWVFMAIGTAVGIVVIAYATYNAVKYRDGDGEDPYADSKKVTRPQLGELPSSSGGGKKLFLSFAISAIIVLGLIVWTYGLLVDYEGATAQVDADMTVDVYGEKFSWTFGYANGENESTLRVPRGEMVRLDVTSKDVFHNFGIPAQKVKADAIPGQVNSAWFVAEETGTFEANCYELCGAGHSRMDAEVIVMEPDAYRQWYQNASG
jgi:cytochrome c oxidase subunit 2